MDPLTFMQLADTQFGMFRNFIDLTPERMADYNSRGLSVRQVEPFDGFAPETERFEKAVDAANTIRPAFVAICGDMVNDPADEAQIAELNRISGGLSSEIPLYRVSGNHDASEDDHITPTTESLARYRELFGDDMYSFVAGGAKFIVINSTVVHHPGEVRVEYDRQIDWLEAELVSARDGPAEKVIVLSHHPLFLEHPDEPDLYFNVPRGKPPSGDRVAGNPRRRCRFRWPYAPEQLRPARQHADDRLRISRLSAGRRPLRLPDGHGVQQRHRSPILLP